ncbi:Retrotransposable element Tf2 protein [Rhizoctonia solani]|uniref:Retrotransposable element Tf2 protein n=1 Tax=Rhizoctonia solani TaxID=456999 RepID=A0A8H8P4M2_9AGAM|nr:Retrotransposable element Tf2 protein [Rhizoctonia solani]QRW25070.1 Retrotransposable element Tf2 protein [Rhizoctonia solani]
MTYGNLFQSSACPQSPLNQGELGPTLPATAVESTSLEPEVYGEVSLSQAISLILGLQNQVLWLERELKETKEATKEAQDWMGAVNQALTCIEARGGAPTHQKTGNPRQLRPRPGPYQKPTLFQRLVPLVAWANPTKAPPAFAQPTPVWAPQEAILPLRLCLSNSAPPSPTTTPVKVDHPDAYTGKIGKQSPPMAHAGVGMGTSKSTDVPHGSGGPVVPPNEHEGRSRSLGTPTSTNLGPTGPLSKQTIAMDLDWNNAALRGQFAHGLHWEVSRLIATRKRRPTTLLELQNVALVINNALREERASHLPKGRRLSSNPNFVSKEEQNRRRAEGLCIKCGKSGHKFAECRTGWKATPKEEGVKKEAAKVGKESGPKSGKD